MTAVSQSFAAVVHAAAKYVCLPLSKIFFRMKTFYATTLCLMALLLLGANTLTAQGSWTVKAPLTDTARTNAAAFAVAGKL